MARPRKQLTMASKPRHFFGKAMMRFKAKVFVITLLVAEFALALKGNFASIAI